MLFCDANVWLALKKFEIRQTSGESPIPTDVVERVKASAAQHDSSVEQELRSLSETRYRSKAEILNLIEARWKDLPKASPQEIDEWIGTGRE